MSAHPVLVLNADYRPLSWYPLSVCSWQSAVRALFLDRVDAIAHYNREIRSPSMRLKIPSIIALKEYIHPVRYPAFTRTSLLLRDRYQCQYCGEEGFIPRLREGVKLNMDHVLPKSRGGDRGWENIVASCHPCNLKKGPLTPEEARMTLLKEPVRPSVQDLWKASKELVPQGHLPEEWRPYLK